MGLLLQVLLLAIGVGGAIVTAITLSDPVWRFRCVVGFSLMGLLGLILTIVTYEGTPGLPHFQDMWKWFLTFISDIQRLPGFWFVVIFFAGLVVGTWLVPLARKRIEEGLIRGPVVNTWLSPLQAIEEFVSSDLLLEDKRASERVEMLTKKIADLNARQHQAGELEDVTVQLNDAKLVAKNRHYAVMESLRVKLGRGQLVAKGFKIKKGKIKNRESYIKPVFWIIILDNGGHTLDPEKRTASTEIFGNYQNVSIGKNESMRK